ncbi:FAS1-like dehydratase domain-containing protein [Flavisphingomonas formosensis]|uniref:FAS1-like dehydratase domain-containing protein n=1 Tax=Flavisphingomonas formosensis TaxID=861534 RepID=UPI001E3322D8|nr:MaoC family dehydratase N-terminal domain-containing protein [Sphingomonas formosensis]
MASNTMVSEDDIVHWRGWIGKEELRREHLSTETLRRFAAALGETLDVESSQPPLAHWAFFLPTVAADQIGPDGHPKRGGFLPPVTLPRRMFAAAEMRFEAPLLLDREAERRSTILDVTHKAGRSGQLVLVQLEHRITQDGAMRINEKQTIVYRDAGAPTPPVVPAEIAPQNGDALWNPTPVDLFRVSAATFNSHRIHYDLPYATGEEGYPGLVVHGPFTAARLFGHARRSGGTPTGFGFRAVAPLFCGQPILLRDDGAGKVRALRCDGADAMIATADFQAHSGH